jgi:aspartate kinase
MIVMKFGGTSVESATAIQRVAGIVRERIDRRPVVVVSAMGKTTNKLLAIAGNAVKGDRKQALAAVSDLHDFHIREARASVTRFDAIEPVIAEMFRDLEELVRGLAIMGELTPRSVDAISAFGERLSSVIVAAAFDSLGIPAVQVDSRDFIITDRRHTHAAPLFAETYQRLAAGIPPLLRDKVVVMGGFIGSTEDGVTSTLGRGGSDYSASIIGAGIGAEEIQIWTDVDGMLTADPTVLPGGHRVRTISFDEAAELAYFGAKVLHPSTVLPAVEKNIPVLILNSRRPEVEGTRIVRDTVKSTNPAKSIACKKNVTILNIHSTRMLMAHGFLRQIFEIFDRHETAVDVVATSEISVSLTIDNDSNLDRVCAELENFAEVSTERGQSIVCIVGDNIRFTPGIAGRVFHALRHVNVRMISQGASELNITIVVAQSDLRAAVEALHAAFFTEVDPAVFEPAAVPVGIAG